MPNNVNPDWTPQNALRWRPLLVFIVLSALSVPILRGFTVVEFLNKFGKEFKVPQIFEVNTTYVKTRLQPFSSSFLKYSDIYRFAMFVLKFELVHLTT